MSLSPQDRQLLEDAPHTNTPIGVVAILGFDKNFPQGWERLRYEEAQNYLHLLKPLMS